MVELDFLVRFALAALATWRVSHLLATEDGPAEIFVRLRAWLGYTWIGRLMDCFLCLSLWIAAPAALFVSRSVLEWVFCWLALSGAACLLERLGQQPVTLQPIYREPGDSNNVLRAEPDGLEERFSNSGAKQGNQTAGDSATRD